MSSEESEYEDQEDSITGEKGRKLVAYAKRKFSWERSNLSTIKAKLDKVHNNNLTLHARAIAKPRYSGGVSSRPAPNGPAFLSLWKLHTKVLEALLSRFSDNKATISGEIRLKAGYEAGFQAGFQQGIALSQLPIQACIPIPLSVAVRSPFFLSCAYVHLSEWAVDAWAHNANHKLRKYATTIGHH